MCRTAASWHHGGMVGRFWTSSALRATHILTRAGAATAAAAVPCVQGAATSVYLCTTPDIKSGEYYADCNIAPSTAASHDADLGARLWELSEQLAASAGSK